MNIKKLISAILCFIMLLGMFSLSGCSGNSEDNATDSILTYEDDAANWNEVFDAIAQCRPGSAGSSLRAYSAAALLLDQSQKSGLKEEDFAEILNAFLDTLGTDELANIDSFVFSESFSLVDEVAKDFLRGEISREMICESSGAELTLSAYEPGLYEFYAQTIRDAIEQ